MLFRKKESKPAPFPPEEYEPVIRSSICTGERTACVRHRETGKVHEIMLIRNAQDLAQFAKQYGVAPEAIQTIY